MVTRRLMLASGLRLVVRDYGSGVPVVLVHAWGETHRSFDRLVRLLAPHLRLVVPDQRGVGDSDKPADGYSLVQAAADLVELLDAIDLPSAFVAGTSSGGYVAQQIGVDHANRVDGLVLVGSPRSLAGGGDPFGAVLAGLHDPVTPKDVRSINSAISFCHPVPADFLTDQDRSALTIPRHVWLAVYGGCLQPPRHSTPVASPYRRCFSGAPPTTCCPAAKPTPWSRRCLVPASSSTKTLVTWCFGSSPSASLPMSSPSWHKSRANEPPPADAEGSDKVPRPSRLA